MIESCLKNTCVRPGVADVGTRGGAADDDPAARAQRADRVGPGGLADGLHDRVDLDGQPRAGLEHLVGAELEGPRTLGLVAAGGEHLEARRAPQRDERGGDSTAGALHEHGLAGLAAALHEEHPVGRQPRGRQARRLLEGERARAWGRGCAAARRPGRRRCPGGARRAATGPGRRPRRPSTRGSPMTPWTTTSLPSSSTPAASQPRIIGSASSRRPTPRSDHRSWWLRLAAFTVTVAHPSGASGAGRSPTTRPLSGSSGEKDSA